jgi:arginine decarboxylase
MDAARRQPPEDASGSWSVSDATELYQVRAWGKGYFGISAAGHVLVHPYATETHGIDLFEVVVGLRERGLTAPLLLRFSDILSHRLSEIHHAFAKAMAENEYRGEYIAVYPIKVNQQRPVIEEVHRYGRAFGFGLEVGSKPELLAVMAMPGESPATPIVCNGFKDDGYIEAVILACKLGRWMVPVVENLNELRLIIKHAEAYQVRPQIGVRVKLASAGVGRWRGSAGMRSKFGLSVSELQELLRVLKQHDMVDCLRLVHCHPGSQLHDIRAVKDTIGELAHVYAELVRMGAGLRYIDVGGGLGVDYDGSQTNSASSMNYTLAEYANEVVYRIGTVCDDKRLSHPTIITESGRAIAAYQSVLVFNVLGSSGVGKQELVEPADTTPKSREETPQPLRDLREALQAVSATTLLECYHDAMQAREQALELFKLGYLSLELRALADQLFWTTCARLREISRQVDKVPDELAELELILAETYLCNFSLFQSLPDSWAIQQLFPIMPIHRLDEPPSRKATLADMTCDSDGKVDCFVDFDDVKYVLDLHELAPGEEYYLAAFLVGAYQETLGDLHNLFGDTHVVHIRLHEEGGWWIDEVVKGDTAADVLSYVQYDSKQLQTTLSHDCEQAVRRGQMTVAESRTLCRFYESALNGYTYLEPE